MWVWVVVGLAAFFVLVALSLCIPARALIDLDTAAETKVRLSLVWIFGLVRSEMTLPVSKKASRKRRARRPPLNAMVRTARTEGLFSGIKKLIVGVVSATRIREMLIRVRVGLSDPAELGMVFGIWSAAKAVMRLPPRYTIDVRPAFSKDVFIEGQVNCALQVRPIRLVVPFGRFLFSRPGRRLMKLAVFRR